MNNKTRPVLQCLAAAVAIGALLVALASCIMPYRTPELHPEDGEFPGIAALLEQRKTIDVIAIHGMCTHTGEWVDKTLERIGTNLPGWSQKGPTAENVNGVDVYISEFGDPAGEKTLRNYAFVWSGLTVPLKRQLCYDSSVATSTCPNPDYLEHRERASVNSELKSVLLNDCFSDAVIYLGGSNGERIRDAIRAAIDFVVRHSATDEDRPKVLISESLGSKVLADSLTEESPKRTERLRLFARTEIVFMAANQIPLLDLAESSPEDATRKTLDDIPRNSMDRLFDAVDALGLPKSVRDRQIVAFTDPNDLLSYEITDSAYDVTNVLVSNDRTWFGLLERPDTAHRGYLDNERVWEFILCGSSRNCDL